MRRYWSHVPDEDLLSGADQERGEHGREVTAESRGLDIRPYAAASEWCTRTR